ncbi:MAG: sigma 54-interacting transcriptional regulator [Pyrinomonadaceae bacterium]|nr:sigma 54-interacting transcriptional regulator [Pyrinomonadaceae bacterium]
MKFDRIEFIARAAASLGDAEGIRAGSASVVENLNRVLGGRFAFVVRRRRDSDVAEIIAASGLGAADFRRLEERIAKSNLWKINHIVSPFVIDELGQDRVLNFLSFGTGAQALIAVPLVVRSVGVGMLAVAFPASSPASENETIKLLRVIAALIAQAMRIEQTVSEESRKLAEENTLLKQELKTKYEFHRLVGNSSQMRQVYGLAEQVARSNATVLLRGEGGTGKELIANAIHYNSLRSKRPFVKVSCSALPDATVERELFGGEMVAGKPRKGRIEQADGGTLYIDEVGDLPLTAQAKLLRVIESSEIERADGSETVRVNIRLITASGMRLEDEIAASSFREDLFYRLNAFTISLPPLRERKSDILLLAEHFVEKYEREHGKRVRRISTPAIDMLTAYHFPGNVRELENVIEHAVLVCDSNVIHGHHLPPTLQTAENSGTETRITLASAVEAFESDLIQDTLKSTRGNIARAAKMLDSTERILGYKIKNYGIDPKRFRG